MAIAAQVIGHRAVASKMATPVAVAGPLEQRIAGMPAPDLMAAQAAAIALATEVFPTREAHAVRAHSVAPGA